MCGILAYFDPKGITKNDVKNSIESLNMIRHRGPDGEGLVLVNTATGDSKTVKTDDLPEGVNWDVQFQDFHGEYDLILGHRRLSIFDTSRKGHQPMFDESSGNVIIFNGEIYNFFELREELEALGHYFKSNTDTEVILKAYTEWGTDCFNKFNGMWSIVIWIVEEKKLIVSNDRFGVKPLYYLEQNDTWIFISEHKQVLPFKNLKLSKDYARISIFLEAGLLNHDENTFFNELKRFPSSYFGILACETWKLSKKRYYDLNKISRVDYDQPYEKFLELFTNAISIRTRADVKWGIGLSGGLDSSAIIYGLNKLLNIDSVASFSSVFPGSSDDESFFIKMIEKDLGHDCNYTYPLDDFSTDSFKKLIYFQDLPVPTTAYFAQWKVAELAKKKHVKVCLVGQGADEIFAGYHHHFYKFLSQNIISLNWLKTHREAKNFAKLKNRKEKDLLKLGVMGVIEHLKSFSNSGNETSVVDKWNQIINLNSIQKLDFNNAMLPQYLHSDDRTGMSHGVESRHPFMDYRLVEFAFSLKSSLKINNGWQKWIVRKSMDDILPNELCWRKDKKGFSNPQKSFEELIKKGNVNLALNTKQKMPFKLITENEFRLFSFGTWLEVFDQ